MTIELVVLDMAGTTVHDGDAVNSCFRAALAGVGVTANPALVNTVMGYHKPEAIRILLKAANRTFTEADVERIHGDFVQRMRQYYAHDPAVRELPGASALFARLGQAGIKTALNSGFSRAIIDDILARLGWNDAVDASIASNEAPRGRPHPDMIRELMRRLGVQQAAHVAKVGDTVVDLEEGKNAGCSLIIGVTTGAYTRQQLEAGPYTHIVDTLAEVERILLEAAARK